MNTPDKPAEAGHLSIPEYNLFHEWFKAHYEFESEETRAIALEAYKYALYNASFSARV